MNATRLTSTTAVALSWGLVATTASVDFAAAEQWTGSPTPAGVRSLVVGAAITISVVHAINTAVGKISRSQARTTLELLALRAEQAELLRLGERVREIRESRERATPRNRPTVQWNGRDWVPTQTEPATRPLGRTS